MFKNQMILFEYGLMRNYLFKVKSSESNGRLVEHRNPPTLASKKFFPDDKIRDLKVRQYI